MTEVRQLKFNFEHEEFEERYGALLSQLNLFELQLEILSSILEDKPVPQYQAKLGEFDLKITDKSQVCRNITAHFIDFLNQSFFTLVLPVLREV